MQDKINQFDADGHRHGPWVFYYSDGNKKLNLWYKGEYQHGRMQGTWLEYHPNGELQTIGNYLNSKPVGYWKDFINNKTLTQFLAR